MHEYEKRQRESGEQVACTKTAYSAVICLGNAGARDALTPSYCMLQVNHAFAKEMLAGTVSVLLLSGRVH